MGGKHKQPQRTKGNVKPSSSGRSAALLGNITFDSFSCAKNSSLVFPYQTFNASDDSDVNIDSNYQIVLKKMSKKDSTTRLKALQEFAKLVETSEAEVVKNILPFWPRLYCMLAGDGEHRVREAAHEAHRMVLLKVKRNMAPHLRHLIGPWFTGQFDLYSPAASAATRAFQDGFPPNKLSEVIVFCQDDILKYICDNVLEYSIEDNASKNASERVDKQERVLATCLQGYVHFICIVPSESLSNDVFIETSKKFMCSKQFWNLAQNKSPVVRCAWMTVLNSIMEKTPELLNEYHRDVVKVIFERLSEMDSVVLPSVWQAALNVITTIKDWYLYCNIEKHVFPRLWSTLKEGGHGNAVSILPNMLPMLNSILLVKKDNCNKHEIMDSLLNCLKEGIMKNSVVHSRIESDAVVKCYMDCIQYVASEDSYEKDIIVSYVIPVIEMALTERKLHLFSKIFFRKLSALLRSWCKKDTPSYLKLYKCFWSKLHTVFEKLSVQSYEYDCFLHILEKEIELCLWLKDPNTKLEKTVRKVRFSSDNEEAFCSSNNMSKLTEIQDSDNEFNHELIAFIKEVCTIYLRNLKQENGLCYMTPLLRLFTKFNDSQLMKNVLSSCNMDELLKYLLQECSHSSVDYVQTTVELALYIIQFLTPEEQDSTLHMMCNNLDVVIWILNAAQKGNCHTYLLKWLKGSFVSNMLVSLTSELCAGKEQSKTRIILMKCTTKTYDMGFLINTETLSLILNELYKVLHKTDITIFAAEFLSGTCVSILKNWNEDDAASIENLSVSIFEIVLDLFCSCCSLQNRKIVSKEIFTMMTASWQDGVRVLTKLKSTNIRILTERFSEIMKEKLLSADSLSHDEVSYLVKNAFTFLNTVSPHLSIELCSSFLNGVLSEYNVWEKTLRSICENAEILLYAPDNIEPMELKEANIPNVSHYVIHSIFSATFIVEILSYIINSNDIKKEEDNTVDEQYNDPSKSDPNNLNADNNYCEEKRMYLLNFELLEENIVQIAFSSVVCDLFTSYFQSTQFYNNIEAHIYYLKTFFGKLNELLHKTEKIESIKSKALEKALKEGGIWVRTLYTLYAKDERNEAYASLVHHSSADYYAQVLLQMADENSEKIPLSTFGEHCSLTTITFWLEHCSIQTITDDDLCTITKFMNNWYEEEPQNLLYDCDISTKEWKDVQKIVKMTYYISMCIEKCSVGLNQNTWDFIMVSCAYYIQNIDVVCKYLFSVDTKEGFLNAWNLSCKSTYNVGAFAMASLHLLNNFMLFCKNVQKEEYSQKRDMFKEIVLEWNEVFACDVVKTILNIYTAISGCPTLYRPSLFGNLLLDRFSTTVINMDIHAVLYKISSGNSAQFLKISCALIHSSTVSVRILSYNILKKFIPKLVESDNIFISNQSPEVTSTSSLKYNIQPFIEAMEEIQSIVDTVLGEFSFGDTCIVKPHTDSYSYTEAYLLLWDLILETCRQANSQLRYHYATLLRNLGYLPNLLNKLFLLMPGDILETAAAKTKNVALERMFSDPPELIIGSVSTSQQLQHWTCWVYYNVLSRLPALVRQWWSDTKPKVSSVVQQITLQYVSPTLCTRELQAIQNQTTNMKSMEVKVHPKVREVIAMYAVDEAQMELIVTLPEIYPLGTVQVDSHTSIVGTTHWRNWVKQLSIFLTHQNGSLWDGLLLWKSNLDKRFEGVEECYICFSILHGTNFQIPELCCKTCKKKFHAPCLYKWFSTSNKSTCPICRNMF